MSDTWLPDPKSTPPMPRTRGPAVKASYTCHVCEIRDREIAVRERGPTEDVVAWMYCVQIVMGDDHARTSPDCPSRHMDLKIPIANAEARIGQAVRQ